MQRKNRKEFWTANGWPVTFLLKDIDFSLQKQYYKEDHKHRGARIGGPRGSNQTSTLLPDADNAAVGSHSLDFLQEVPKKVSPVFYDLFVP